MSLEDRMSLEDKVIEAVEAAIRNNSDEFRYAFHWGDGKGGWILGVIKEIIGCVEIDQPRIYRKKVVSKTKKKQVFERDRYRCKHCDTHLDLSVDHIIPESKGGSDDIDNLQTLCRPCNSSKGVGVHDANQ